MFIVCLVPWKYFADPLSCWIKRNKTKIIEITTKIAKNFSSNLSFSRVWRHIRKWWTGSWLVARVLLLEWHCFVALEVALGRHVREILPSLVTRGSFLCFGFYFEVSKVEKKNFSCNLGYCLREHLKRETITNPRIRDRCWHFFH